MFIYLVLQVSVYEEIKDKLPMKASEFRKLTKSLAKPLIEKGYVELRKLPKSNDVLPSYIEDSIHELTFEQKHAIEEIENSNGSCFLLHGVTGSGKTEVTFSANCIRTKQTSSFFSA